MIYRRDYRTLIDQGRKAGLGTAEIYQALAGQRSEAVNVGISQADGNGFVSGYGQNGRPQFRPIQPASDS
jgi:hypothetical protein